jgi:hypothetical protein
MKFTATVLFSVNLVAAVLGATITRHYTDTDVYSRRNDDQKVNKKMVEYWTRPDVLPTLPEGMKNKVETYVKKFPEYHYKGEPKTPDSKNKKGPCITQ